ncbi:MAG: glycosyltransferase family 4 protein [bacterium]
MKIAFIGQKGIPSIGGGVERYVEDLSTHLVAYGHEAIVYTRKHYTPEHRVNFKGVKLVSLPSINTKHLDAITHTIVATIHASLHKVDLVHYQMIGAALMSWLPKLLNPRVRIVSTLQSKDYEHQKWGRFARFMLLLGEKMMCYFSDEIIVVTKSMRKYVRQKYNRDSVYIPNGALLHPRAGADRLKNFGLTKDSYIVSVSRIVRHKGLGYLISAYKNLKTDKKLVIVGGGAFTDDYVSELKTFAESNPNIIFTGSQTGENLAQLYENAYVFVQPSESEGLSLALLEAMARRKACLVSDIQENKEAVQETGFVFKNKNIDDLTEQLNYVLNNPAEVKTKGLEARQRIEEVFNWSAIAKNMIKVYKSVSTEKQPWLVLKKKYSIN